MRVPYAGLARNGQLDDVHDYPEQFAEAFDMRQTLPRLARPTGSFPVWDKDLGKGAIITVTTPMLFLFQYSSGYEPYPRSARD